MEGKEYGGRLDMITPSTMIFSVFLLVMSPIMIVFSFTIFTSELFPFFNWIFRGLLIFLMVDSFRVVKKFFRQIKQEEQAIITEEGEQK